MIEGRIAAASKRSPALRDRELAGNSFIGSDSDRMNYLEYIRNLYFLAENTEEKAYTNKQEMVSLLILDKALQSALRGCTKCNYRYSPHTTVITHGNGCKAIL